ncbi:Trafficking protein particle complex subunit 1 [Yarrowia sp. C11]|nr:Trafficking protein particle complex subunit 1 [Yarrowia sp. E02]KAG5372947.1 Trafficking protein particle complex subunit 1 [Yarrowia sp. C11]
MIYSFWIFDRHSECIYSKEWSEQPTYGHTGNHSHNASISSNHSFGSAQGSVGSSSRRASRIEGIPSVNTSIHPVAKRNREDEAKLIFGAVFSLRNMATKWAGENGSDSFVSFKTNKYKLHYFETPTNLKMVLLTDPSRPSLRDSLHDIYVNLFVEYVTKNALSPQEFSAANPIDNDLFNNGVDTYIKGLA